MRPIYAPGLRFPRDRPRTSGIKTWLGCMHCYECDQVR